MPDPDRGAVNAPGNLAQWLEHWERVHPQAIAMGLERVAQVASRLPLQRPAPIVLTVGGTNGKGSTVAFIDAIARAADCTVGTYTSPHLLAYNERVCIDGVPVDDVELVHAFVRIERARGEIPLTWFEAGTLAALLVFEAREVDVAVLEVGMGGRLDAVNLVDADVAVITTVDLDHQQWLGDNRESIGYEKAGIMRAGCPVVLGELQPPHSVLTHAQDLGALVYAAGIEFHTRLHATGWTWSHRDGTTLELPFPELWQAAPGSNDAVSRSAVTFAATQLRNAAAAVAAVHALGERLKVTAAAYARGVRMVQIAGRLQQIASEPQVMVDVAHNPQAATALAAWLAQQAPLPTVAVFSVLGDKDVAAIVAPLAPLIRHWWVFGLADETPRGLDAQALDERVRAAGVASSRSESIEAALAAARAAVGPQGRVLVFGSFFTVAAALRACGFSRLGQD